MSISNARAVQRMNAGVTCRRSLVRSPPCAPGRVPPARKAPSSNGQDLRVRISGWRFESARSHVTYRLRSGIGLVSKSDQRGSTPRRPASAASSSPGGEIGFIRRTCRVRSPGLLRRAERRLTRRMCRSSVRFLASSSPGGDRSPTNCTRRARFPGSLPVPLAQRQVQSPDERTTEVRVLHGAPSMVCAV